MLMTRRLPFWDMDRMFDEMSRMFDTFGGPLGLRSVPGGTFPAMNVYDAKDKLIVTVEIPGVDPATIELSVQENSLTLSGKRSDTENGKGRYYRKERPTGEFHRTITLNEKVDPAGVAASYKDGILRIEMPKAQAVKPRTIAIKAE